MRALIALSGRVISRNNFSIVSGELALLRADWSNMNSQDKPIAEVSSAEISGRQPDGSWRSVIDHAIGTSLARVAD